ncbi:MAG: protein phosphatase 2C domain-containing protein [Pseudomonadales bacterium]|jgi:serine/threonine protein phosphatase PrpC|nr:protein phosphatase 2C domain-containing protein [Pseudomonadales bacterium]|tara:strand:+ start:299 stop:985 length:687 start_codon:yes stop_codon:yes gene_type:complete
MKIPTWPTTIKLTGLSLDGMGGHSAGDVASQTVVKALHELEQKPLLSDFVDDIEDCLVTTNSQLVELAAKDNNVVGTTVVGFALRQSHCLYYWVGDSRLYRLRGEKLLQLSIDHTYTQEMIQHGELTPEEARDHPQKNVITRAVGGDSELFTDFEMDAIQHGDCFLICSDGVEKKSSDQEVEAIMLKHGNDLDKSGQEIIDLVVSRGAPDNVTLILVLVQDLPDDKKW